MDNYLNLRYLCLVIPNYEHIQNFIILIMYLLLLDPLLNVDNVIGSEHGAHDGLQAEGHAALLGAVVHQLTLLPSLVLSTKYFT